MRRDILRAFTPMLTRLVAVLFVVLVALPFTEPFRVVNTPLSAPRHVTASTPAATAPAVARVRLIRFSATSLSDTVVMIGPGQGGHRLDAAPRLTPSRSVRVLVLRL